MPCFKHHPERGTTAHMTAGERLQHSLNSGLPDEEITAPIGAWQHSSVTEFGSPLAGLLTEKEGAL